MFSHFIIVENIIQLINSQISTVSNKSEIISNKTIVVDVAIKQILLNETVCIIAGNNLVNQLTNTRLIVFNKSKTFFNELIIVENNFINYFIDIRLNQSVSVNFKKFNVVVLLSSRFFEFNILIIFVQRFLIINQNFLI